ncbi:MAG: 2-C-methyl-D-erythritol 2,4-cyclodiphosphate synthase [Christensenellaceae bacterium]|jgi:2-C-methyl-D-erythritol 2,4-cyclodiphosphate synthase/2-C-methyl-D-erythritol 4-phosphate cytidylyltransferase|nr:2-C-methyl-D-erythritol 2,4-cyclodiphosphate synthase [Christensenellaceae bacterium]
MRVTGILLAAGASSRMGHPKLTLPLCGHTALERSFMALKSAGIADIVIAVCDATRAQAERLAAQGGAMVIEGGQTRGESVYKALSMAQGDIVVIHDAARCLVPGAVIRASIAGAGANGSGVAALRPADTVWQGDAPLNRDALYLTQTPQAFNRARILAAYESARAEGISATDDAALYARHWGSVHFTGGSPRNIKLTAPEDIPLFEAILKGSAPMRMGYGEDTHRLVQGRKLILGGVDIPFELGLLGHSDADALTHAVMDALLGAAALGDIGRHFPDTDIQYKDICSLKLLARVGTLLREKGYGIGNISATIIAQKPRLAAYMPDMCKRIADALGIEAGRVNIQATTTEGCGKEGRLECITARCVCAIEENLL